jgi:hypothetical protein
MELPGNTHDDARARLVEYIDEMADESEAQLREWGITRKELAERAGYKSIGGGTNKLINRILENRGLQVNQRGQYIGHIPEE